MRSSPVALDLSVAGTPAIEAPVGSDARIRPLASKMLPCLGSTPLTRRTASPLRRPGRRCSGAHAISVVLPSSWALKVIVPLSVP